MGCLDKTNYLYFFRDKHVGRDFLMVALPESGKFVIYHNLNISETECWGGVNEVQEQENCKIACNNTYSPQKS